MVWMWGLISSAMIILGQGGASEARVAVVNVPVVSERYLKTADLEAVFEQRRKSFTEQRDAMRERLERLRRSLEEELKPGTKEFEERRRVSLDDYLLMIQKKTGRMVTASTEIGALIGNGTDTELDALRQYGELLGQAFQIQDDLLDIIGDEKKFGKKIGGDVQEGKKTFLLLEALRRSRGKDRQQLMEVISRRGVPRSKIPRIRAIYESTGAIDAALGRIAADIDGAKRQLGRLRSSEATSMLHWFSDMLLNRKF